MGLTLGEAAKHTGKSKPTLSRAIKIGKLSATKNEDGSFSIDPAELFRVYGPVSETAKNETPVTPVTPDSNTETSLEMMELRLKLEAANQRIADLEQDKEDWKQQATRLLTVQQSNSGGFFSKLFGK